MSEPLIPPYPEAVAREKKLAFVTCALLGMDEAARWVRDPELTRRVAGALGRAMDLLRQCQAVTEAESDQQVRHAG